MTAFDRIDELKKRYEENPRRFFASLANEYRKAGDLEQAIALCQMHLAEQPANMNGHVVYGQALFEAGRFDEAKATFETALTLDSENLIALRHLGDIACTNGANDEAREWYERVLDFDPRNHQIIALLAQLAKESKQAAHEVPVETAKPVEQQPPAVAEAPVVPPHAAVPAETPPFPQLSERVAPAELPEDLESSPESLVWIDPPALDEDAAALEIPSFDDGSLGAPLDAAALTPDVFGDFMADPFAEPTTGDPGAPPATDASVPRATSTSDYAGVENLYGDLDAAVPETPELAEMPEAPETPAAPSPPFVTETMAELYLHQGFHDEALEVYRQLLRANPDDEELKRRVRKLARGDRDSMPFDLVPAPAPEVVSTPRPTARSYFAGLALRPAARRNGSAATGPSLDRLFQGGSVSSDDEQSAHMLAQVAGSSVPESTALDERPAAGGASLDSIFRDAAERVTPTVPRHSQTLRFDQFFSTTADEASVASEAPPSPASPAPASEPGSPAELKQFQSWLLGLKKQ